MPTIVHFDFSADDTDRARNFYSTLFGWKFESYPGPMEYSLITTTNLDGTPGVGGGLGKRTDPSQRGSLNYMGVLSLDHAMEQVKRLGGSITIGRMAVPQMGYLAVCQDPDGNAFGLWEANPEAR